MKKFAKMSLVAAMAVAGMTSANAKDLAEAIKNVDVSGGIVYRYDDKSFDKSGNKGSTGNYYKASISLKSKVNDDVTANVRIITKAANGKNGLAALDTNEDPDGSLNLALSQASFTYTGLANTSITVGKQGIPTPWTVAIDTDGDEATGTGILALTNVGPVTLAGAYFNQTNLDKASSLTDAPATGALDIWTAGAIANIAGVKAEAWYLDADDTFDSFFLAAGYSFKLDAVTLGLDGKYTSLDYDANSEDHGNWQLGLKAKMGIFNAGVRYAESEENGSGTIMSLSKTAMSGYSTNIHGTSDAEMWMFDLGAQVTDKLHIALNYDKVEEKKSGVTNDDIKEAFLQATYKMSKNFMTYVRLADGEDDDKDYKRGRLQVQYSF